MTARGPAALHCAGFPSHPDVMQVQDQAKIAATVPEHLRPYIVEPSVGAKPVIQKHEDEIIDPSMLRAAVREGRKLRLRYRSDAGEETLRTVWPVILGYSETSRILVAWCELRQGFRHFRTDRILAADILDEAHGLRPGELRRRWSVWRGAILQQPERTVAG